MKLPRIKRAVVGVDNNGHPHFFSSLAEAAKAVGTNSGNIRGSCERSRGLVKHHKWFFRDDNRWHLAIGHPFELKAIGKGYREVGNLHKINKTNQSASIQLSLFNEYGTER